MRKIFFFLLCTALFTACNDDNTPDPTPTGDPFTIALSDITSSSVKITVTPTSETQVYYYDVLQKAAFAEHHNSNVATYITRLLNDNTQWDEGTTIADRVDMISTTGKETYEAKKLAAETEYIVFAVGLNSDGTLSTEAVITEFATLVKEDTGLTFEVNALKTEWDNIDFEVIPSNNEESYFYTIKSTAFCESMSAAELFALVLGETEWMIPFSAKRGPSSEIRTPDGAPFNYYNPNTGYTLLVFGYDLNAYQTSTDLFKFEMRTTIGEGSPAACTFDVTISDLKNSKMTVAIAASNPKLTYLWDLIDDATYQIYKNRFNDYVASYVVEIGGSAKIDEQCSVGESGLPFSELSPSTTYYVWAICIDEYGIPTANVVLSEPIRTPDPVVSTATVTTAVKYFNGDEVATQHPQYESSKGMAFVVMTFGHSEDAAMWYGGLSEEDLSNPTTITDTQIINLLTDTQYIEDYWLPVTKLRNCNWNTPYTLFTVAKDKDENYSRVSRQVFTFTKAGAAPIAEFVVPTAMNQSQISSFLKPVNKTQKATIKSYKPIAKKR